MNARLGLAAVVLLAAAPAYAAPVINYGPGDHFSGTELIAGSTSSPEDCQLIPNAVWVGTDCLRYYPSSRMGTSVLIVLPGDVIRMEHGSPVAEVSYTNMTPADVAARTEKWATPGVSVVFLGRPGAWGSSGNENKRRQYGEAVEINAAITQIVARYHVTRLGLAGQSGGGGLVGALIAERSDILCAVSSSGALAVNARTAEIGQSIDPTGARTVYDPIDQIGRVRPAPGFRMFVVSDRGDMEVPYQSQQLFVQKALQHGLNVVQMFGHGTGPKHHGLLPYAVAVGSACLLGRDSAAIQALPQP